MGNHGSPTPSTEYRSALKEHQVRPITDQDIGLKIIHDGTKGTDPTAADNIEYVVHIKERGITYAVAVSLPFMVWERTLMIPGANESKLAMMEPM